MAQVARVLALALLAGCATASPEVVSVRWVRVAQTDIHRVCSERGGAMAPVIGQMRACSTWNRDAGTCTIWASDFKELRERELMASLGHELKHCFDGAWH